MSESNSFTPGSWVVHRNHGIGRIDSMVEMSIGEQANIYCKIETFNSTIWLPEEKMNDEWLRPIASPAEVDQALEILKSPPEPMADDILGRRRDIKLVDSYDAPIVIAKLLRDLWALKKVKKALSQVEEDALRHYTNCFLAEWSVSMGMTVGEARAQFDRLTKIGRDQLAENLAAALI